MRKASAAHDGGGRGFSACAWSVDLPRHVARPALREVMCCVACLALLAGGLTSWGGRAWAQSQSTGAATAAGGKTFEMTAEQVTYRGKDRVTVAEGKVLIVYESFMVSGDWAEYDDRVPCVRVRGKERVRFEDTADKTVLSAGEIVFYLSDEKVEASGGVTLSYQGGRSLASGDILTYLGREKKGVVAGNARVELGGKVFTAASVTVFFSEERIIATGGTRTIIPSEEITAPDSSSPGKEQ